MEGGREPSTLQRAQQLFHPMGRDCVPMDGEFELNPTIRTPYLKRQRQHSRKEHSHAHVFVSDVAVRTSTWLWGT